MNLYLLSFLSLLAVSFTAGNIKQKHVYENRSVKCIYETENGIINGKYISYYKNGKKKAEGEFENNLRKGLWSVWDSTGRLRMQRDYTNPFVFKRLIPEYPADKPIQLLNVPSYELKYNKDGYIDYFKLEERMVVWTKKLWRFITVTNNDQVFKENRLFKLLQDNLKTRQITSYTDDEFTAEVPFNEFDSSKESIIGYRISEITFFDNERLISETRIIGLSPVYVSTTGDTTELYWIYFPSIRKLLAQEKLESENNPAYIKTMDDLFFYRMFSSNICKEINADERKLTENESEKVQMFIIEVEHDLWISLTK